jgi:hypothetical protein
MDVKTLTTTQYQRGMIDAAAKLDETNETIRLACGELTADEMRAVRAALKWKKSQIESEAQNAGCGF